MLLLTLLTTSLQMNGMSMFCPQDEDIFLNTPSFKSMKTWDLTGYVGTVQWLNMWSQLYTGVNRQRERLCFTLACIKLARECITLALHVESVHLYIRHAGS